MSGPAEDVIHGWSGEKFGNAGQWAGLEESGGAGAVAAEHGSYNITTSLGFFASAASAEGQRYEDIR